MSLAADDDDYDEDNDCQCHPTCKKQLVKLKCVRSPPHWQASAISTLKDFFSSPVQNVSDNWD